MEAPVASMMLRIVLPPGPMSAPYLVGRDADARHAGSVGVQFRAVLCDCAEHMGEDKRAAFLGLRERLPEDLLRYSGDLDVHLQRGDAFGAAGNLEVHVAEEVLYSLDVGQHLVIPPRRRSSSP